MDQQSSLNDHLEIALNEWILTEYYNLLQSHQTQQQLFLNGQIPYTIMPETELLEPVDLTHHCECIGEPLTPTAPQLTEEWIEKCNEYRKEGPSVETLKQMRQSSWQSYLSHDDDDFRNLMMNIYVDDSNQRLLNMHKNHLHLSQPQENMEQKLTNPTDDNNHFGHLESINEPLSPMSQDYMEERRKLNLEFVEISTYQHTQQMNNYNNAYVMDMTQVDTYFRQPHPEQQQQQQPLNNQKRFRRRRNRNRNRRSEPPVNFQESQMMQPTLHYQEGSPFHYNLVEVDDYNQRLFNMNVDFPYLRTPIDEDTYMY